MMIISTIVLFFTALLLFIILSGSLSGFFGTLTGSTGESTCMSKKDYFCKINPESDWAASSLTYYNKTCEEIIGEKVYNCKEERWEGCSYWCKEIQRLAISGGEDSELSDKAVDLYTNICVYKNDCKEAPECSNIDFERCEGTASEFLKKRD